ncbi:HXXEE domain-containing protein [Kribbella sp. DT2]|uniref:HXXEE domain-containing protein n=1 Tax=Kribbella sp. DT2 TaxID=3393427 RepID=UPI003CEC7ACD
MKGIAWGLLAAWVIHDAEELATMAGWSREAPEQVRAVLPGVPDAVVEQLPMTRAEAATAIGLTGVVMAAASFAGARSGGRSAFFQAALTGFGMHGVTHLAQSAVLRRYTPGLVTTPLVVIPFSLWAWRRLRAYDVPPAPSNARLNLALAAAVPLSHAIARLPRLRRPRG